MSDEHSGMGIQHCSNHAVATSRVPDKEAKSTHVSEVQRVPKLQPDGPPVFTTRTSRSWWQFPFSHDRQPFQKAVGKSSESLPFDFVWSRSRLTVSDTVLSKNKNDGPSKLSLTLEFLDS